MAALARAREATTRMMDFMVMLDLKLKVTAYTIYAYLGISFLIEFLMRYSCKNKLMQNNN